LSFWWDFWFAFWTSFATVWFWVFLIFVESLHVHWSELLYECVWKAFAALGNRCFCSTKFFKGLPFSLLSLVTRHGSSHKPL
jgi:hypothetical protein